MNTLKVLIYEYLSFEESRLENNIHLAFNMLCAYPYDSYYITKYYEAVRRYEDFRIVQLRLYEILRYTE